MVNYTDNNRICQPDYVSYQEKPFAMLQLVPRPVTVCFTADWCELQQFMHIKCLKTDICALISASIQQVYSNFAYLPESAIRGQYSGLAEYARMLQIRMISFRKGFFTRENCGSPIRVC